MRQHNPGERNFLAATILQIQNRQIPDQPKNGIRSLRKLTLSHVSLHFAIPEFNEYLHIAELHTLKLLECYGIGELLGYATDSKSEISTKYLEIVEGWRPDHEQMVFTPSSEKVAPYLVKFLHCLEGLEQV